MHRQFPPQYCCLIASQSAARSKISFMSLREFLRLSFKLKFLIVLILKLFLCRQNEFASFIFIYQRSPFQVILNKVYIQFK
jgi:hypothetical protein